jgi:glycosidase
MLGRDHLYRRPQSLVTFLGLHDVTRFMGESGATLDGLKLAFTFLLTARGTPLLYYGDEIALAGGGDPDNRRDFPGGWPGDARNAFAAAGRSAPEQQMFDHVHRLLRLRAERADLRAGATHNLFLSDQAFVYQRGASVVALNNDTSAVDVKLPALPIGNDALGYCAPARRVADGVMISIPARTGCVF